MYIKIVGKLFVFPKLSIHISLSHIDINII